MKTTAEEVAFEIFYKPATNGKAAQSIKEGAELIEAYAEEKVNSALQEAAEKVEEQKKKAIGWDNQAHYFDKGIESAKESILSLQIKDK